MEGPIAYLMSKVQQTFWDVEVQKLIWLIGHYLASTITTQVMKWQVSAVEVSLQGKPNGVQKRSFVFRRL